MLRELPPPSPDPPKAVHALRAIGVAGLSFMVISTVTAHPEPALHGKGLGVLISLVAIVAGCVLSFPRRVMDARRRLGSLLAVAAGGIALTALQPLGAAIGATYYVMSVSSVRLGRRPGVVLSVGMLIGQGLGVVFTSHDVGGDLLALFFTTIPWLLIVTLMGELREGRERAEQLVEELRESREAHAQSVTLAERARLARDMHDVLAHSLSALALQLEGTRLQAADRGTDPEVVAAIERAHHLAAGGLDEARRAIAALRGDELPGPERLRSLAAAFEEHTAARCTVTITGDPTRLSPEARLALYRVAQEALTNIRRHAAADRVELRVLHADEGTTLVVSDHGPGAPVMADSGGYGLTGMRERAELLGGRLTAGPTDDGFRVELWLPAGPAAVPAPS
jgi:signal transduction histidine kinase